VVETERRREEKTWLCTTKRLFRSEAPDCPVVHRTVSGGAPDSVRCARLPRPKWPLSGIRRRRTAIIHRIVRCAPDCPVSQRSARANGRPRFLRATRGQGNGRKGAPDCPVCTGHVRCANGAQICNRQQRSDALFMEINRAPDSVRCAPDCPVRPTTEGKDSLPDVFSTAPSCLGAIKGTPRRMEEDTKHSYNTPKHQDIDLAHLFHCDSI
jgi:hypothetical protein